MAKGDKKSKKTQKKTKDEDKPKKPLSAYFFYIKDRRPKLIEENPKLENKEIVMQMGKEWNSMSDDEKKPFAEKAEKDKERYEKEMEAYSAKKKEVKGKKK